MTYRTLQEATEALSQRLVAMIPEHYADDETFANTDLTRAGLFAGLDVNPAELQAIASTLANDNATGSLELLIPFLRRDLDPLELMHVAQAISTHMAGVLAVGYVLGRLHDPERPGDDPTPHPEAYAHCRNCGLITTLDAASNASGRIERCYMCDAPGPGLLPILTDWSAGIFPEHVHDQPLGPEKP